MKIYKVDFEPMYPVPCGLIIAAENLDQAEWMARQTIKHTDIMLIHEVELTQQML